MAFEFPTAFIETTFHVAKAGSKPDILNECYQRQLMLRANRLDEVVSPLQNTGDRGIGNEVRDPENSHSTYSPRSSNRMNGVNDHIQSNTIE